jgi:hypothetical protein
MAYKKPRQNKVFLIIDYWKRYLLARHYLYRNGKKVEKWLQKARLASTFPGRLFKTQNPT